MKIDFYLAESMYVDNWLNSVMVRTDTIYLLAKSVIVLVILFSDPEEEFNYEIVLNYFGMFTFFLSRI